MKIVFLGAGSTIFAKRVLLDCMSSLMDIGCEIAIYDIDQERLKITYDILVAANQKQFQSKYKICTYCNVENRRKALKKADFVINAMQIGKFEPCTINDFEIPKKYGLRQTIGDTVGIGGIMRGLRTIPVIMDIIHEMEEICPNAYFLNYANPMAIVTGFIQRYSSIKCIGLCHSVQVCTEHLLKDLGMDDKLEGRTEKIAGINHMAWLLEIHDRYGNDLYPEIRKRARVKSMLTKHGDMVRYSYLKNFGYYCTESSEHNAEYNPYFIKKSNPELIEKFNIPLDEYLRRCRNQIERFYSGEMMNDVEEGLYIRSNEYASYIIEAIVKKGTFSFAGNVQNQGNITNLPKTACVEVKCNINKGIIEKEVIGNLPLVLAALNMTNINTQTLTIHAAYTKKKEDIYRAAMLDPHTAAELSLDEIVSMCNEMIKAHGEYMSMYL